MKTLLKVFVSFVSLVVLTSFVWAADVDLPPAIEKAIESRVMICVSFFGFWESQGTGFVADEDGYVITASHLFDRIPSTFALARVPIFVRKDLNDEPTKARLIARDPTKDLALIKVEELEKIGPPVKWANAFPGKGEEVYYSGFFAEENDPPSATFKATVQDGLASITIERKTISGAVILDRKIPLGFSGGPVFNAEGEAVGMNSFTYLAEGGIIPCLAIRIALAEIR